MMNGFHGTFVISWTQTELDGQVDAPVHALRAGAAWRWSGETVRVDGPGEVLQLGPAEGMTEMRRRAAQTVRKLVRAAETGQTRLDEVPAETPLAEQGFTVTDGTRRWQVTAIATGRGRGPLCMFLGEVPPADRELWIVEETLSAEGRDRAEPSRSVICFTPGTMIHTETGLRPVEEIGEGERVQTRDNGCQPVLWIGTRRISGARLHALPELAPIRLRPGALGRNIPDSGLLVSPDHRLVLGGDLTREAFNTPEVLVRARDLVDGRSVTIDRGLRQVTYIHLALEAHEVVFANSVPTESFHPASIGLEGLDEGDRARLIDLVPDVVRDPMSYGAFARRMLSGSEAAILTGLAA